MSELNDIKVQVSQISSDATDAANDIARFRQSLSDAMSQVQGVIGGTADGTDTKLTATLSETLDKLDTATQALHQVARDADDWIART